MGHYAHLFSSDHDIPNYGIEEDCVALQARSLVPIF